MDADLEKEQIGTLFVWWGHWKGGLGVGWRGVHPKKYLPMCLPKRKISSPLFTLLFLCYVKCTCL
jgi:hypothetical protein